ncbi:MAG: universal stress protein [Candidatus Nitrosopolaris sp.]
MTTKTQAASDDERKETEIKNILVPIDGSDYSLSAAQFATRIARSEKAQLFCIHIVTPRMPYGYATPAASPTKNRYYDDIKNKVESWFDIVRNMAKDEGIPDIKTEIFIDVISGQRGHPPQRLLQLQVNCINNFFPSFCISEDKYRCWNINRCDNCLMHNRKLCSGK